jgi:hypothetical protein
MKELIEEETQLSTQITIRAQQEEQLWKQKSRIQWLKVGEKIPSSSTSPCFREDIKTRSHL